MMMKWYGWGDPKVSFPVEKKPKLWPWIKKTLQVERTHPTPHVDRSAVRVPAPILHDQFVATIRAFFE